MEKEKFAALLKRQLAFGSIYQEVYSGMLDSMAQRKAEGLLRGKLYVNGELLGSVLSVEIVARRDGGGTEVKYVV